MMTACVAGVAQEGADNVYGLRSPHFVPVMPDTLMEMKKPIDPSLSLPSFNTYTVSPLLMPDDYWGGYNLWNLHPGLNVSMGMSVSVGLGKSSYSGVGFAQNLALMYALQLSKRFSLAVGGYFNRLNWNGFSCNDAGFSAVLGYHIDNRWDAFVYGQKSLFTPRMPRQLRYMGNISDKIGAMVSYKLSPSATICVSVETDRR